MLNQIFSFVCGQVPDRTWAPGAEVLPFCQRCTGLYLGALAACLWTVLLRPAPSRRRLLFDGLCLLQMVPLGYHWIEHGAWARTTSGAVFALGLVDFLWLLPAARWGGCFGKVDRQTDAEAAWRTWLQAALTAVVMVGLCVAVARGGIVAAQVISWLGLAGLAVLTFLALVNLVLLLSRASHEESPGRQAAPSRSPRTSNGCVC